MNTGAFELPPLPDAIPIRAQLVDDGSEITVGRGYSDEQMREYARYAVLRERERCAKVCEQYSDNVEDVIDMFQRGCFAGALECAAAIRHQP